MKDALSILQVRENVFATFRHYGLPLLSVMEDFPDAVMLHGRIDFLEVLYGLVRIGKFEPYNSVGGHGRTALQGWREAVAMYSMQIVEHIRVRIEVDFDIFNPSRGLGPLIGHGLECLWPGRTSPWRIMKGLRRRGIAVADVRKGKESCTNQSQS